MIYTLKPLRWATVRLWEPRYGAFVIFRAKEPNDSLVSVESRLECGAELETLVAEGSITHTDRLICSQSPAEKRYCESRHVKRASEQTNTPPPR